MAIALNLYFMRSHEKSPGFRVVSHLVPRYDITLGAYEMSTNFALNEVDGLLAMYW